MKERIELPAIITTQVRRVVLNNYSLCNMEIPTRVLNLPGIETAGNMNILLTDKTGTFK